MGILGYLLPCSDFFSRSHLMFTPQLNATNNFTRLLVIVFQPFIHVQRTLLKTL